MNHLIELIAGVGIGVAICALFLAAALALHILCVAIIDVLEPRPGAGGAHESA